MNAAERRALLVRWVAESPHHDDLTASQIADLSGIYTGHGQADRCFDDLKALADDGLVERSNGRPATWALVVWETR